jgi:preprotein translocase subunit SecF
MPLRLIPDNTKIDFVSKRRYFFLFSGILFVLAVASTFITGLNFGIDFRGGIVIGARMEQTADIGAIRSELSALNLGEVSIQRFGRDTDVLIRVEAQQGGEVERNAAIGKIKNALGPNVTYLMTDYVGPQVGGDLIRAGIMAVVFSIIGILIYVWFRFEWQFGAAAVIALTHDVLLTLGFFAELELEFNLATVAAVLTIAGYSINDTVVVFDRVRENLRKYKKMPLPELMNQSINETLSRTVLTSGTTLLAVMALVVFGGPVIRDFCLALVWGIVIGTYSSICLAVPILLYFNIRREGMGGRTAEEAAATP